MLNHKDPSLYVKPPPTKGTLIEANRFATVWV